MSYDLNRLMRLSEPQDYVVTLNGTGRVAGSRVIAKMSYEHPVFTASGVAAQVRHPELIDHRRTSYCGAYWRNGFHEDGVVSALCVCRRFEVSL